MMLPLIPVKIPLWGGRSGRAGLAAALFACTSPEIL